VLNVPASLTRQDFITTATLDRGSREAYAENVALAAGLDAVFDPADYDVERGAKQEYLFDSELLQLQ